MFKLAPTVTVLKGFPDKSNYRVEQTSTFWNLPSELIFLIYSFLPPHAKETLRQSCAKFIYTFHPRGQNLLRGVWYRLEPHKLELELFKAAWKRDVYNIRTVTAERHRNWHFFRQACCSHCGQQHSRKFFTNEELTKDPAERICIGVQDFIRITQSMSLRYPEIEQLPFEADECSSGSYWKYRKRTFRFDSRDEFWWKTSSLQYNGTLMSGDELYGITITSEMPPAIEKTNFDYTIRYRKVILRLGSKEATTREMLTSELAALETYLVICPHVSITSPQVVGCWDGLDGRHLDPFSQAHLTAASPSLPICDPMPGLTSGAWDIYGACERKDCDTRFWFGRNRLAGLHQNTKLKDEVYLAVERRLGLNPTDPTWLSQLSKP